MSNTLKSAVAVEPSVIVARIVAKGMQPHSIFRHDRLPSTTRQNSLLIQNTVMEVFRRNDHQSMDLEALVFLTLQRLEVSVETYETLYKLVRNHVMEYFPAQGGKHLLLQEVSMRRMIVSCPSSDC